jgi:hypothetical protein
MKVLHSDLNTRLVLGLLLFLAPAVRAQQVQFEYGKPAEMHGLTRFFLDTQGNMKRRDQIIELLQKKLPNLKFTESADDAQAVIVYTEEQSIRLVSGTSILDLSCTAQVTAPLAPGKARLLFSYTMKKKNIFQHDPYKNFVGEFVKAYQEANRD